MPQRLWIVRLGAVVALGLHGLAYILPADQWWSVTSYTIFPRNLGLGLIILVGLLIFPPLSVRLTTLSQCLWQYLPGKRYPQRWFIGLSLAALPLFWSLRIRHLNWGDAQILVIGLSYTDAPVIYNWQAPFTVFLHQRLWALWANPYLGWGVETVYAVVSVLCGGLFVYLALNLSRAISQHTLERVTIATFLLTSGSLQLFFGYVENYTLISVGITAFLWAGLLVNRQQVGLWVVSFLLALTNGFHPSTVMLWPAVLYLAWRQYQQDVPFLKICLDLFLPPLIVAQTVLTLMELGDHGLSAFLGDDSPGGGDHIWLVPLFLETPTQWQRYSMFSPAHFLDWVNELFLTSVFGLFVVVWGYIEIWWRKINITRTTLERDHFWFLSLASGGYLLLTWLWNADYGMRKDWDLFAPSALVYSVLAGFLLPRLLTTKTTLAQANIMIILVSGLHTLAWILSNAYPEL